MRHHHSEPATGFPLGDSTAAGLIRTGPWADGPLGPMADWPQSLMGAVDLALNSPLAMLVLWGPELVRIYNDTFVIPCGDKHPHGFGQPHEAVWPEVWEFNQPIFDDRDAQTAARRGAGTAVSVGCSAVGLS